MPIFTWPGLLEKIFQFKISKTIAPSRHPNVQTPRLHHSLEMWAPSHAKPLHLLGTALVGYCKSGIFMFFGPKAPSFPSSGLPFSLPPSLRASDLGPSSRPAGNPSPDRHFPLLPPMAGRFGFGPSSTTNSMIVVSTPNQELALTNFAYCSAGDLRKFSIPGSSLALALVGDSVVLTLRYPSLILFSFFSLSTDLNAGLLELSVFLFDFGAGIVD